MYKSELLPTVFITGAASGIGQAQAEAFLYEGAKVFGYDLQKQGLQDLQTKYPKSFSYQTGNVTDTESIAKAVRTAIKQFGSISVLLNTAGILDAYTPTLETDEALWNSVLQTNLTGTYLVTNTVLPYMLQENKGVIINMASIAGLIAGGGGAAYTASKHAIIGYTKQLAYDYARKGIRANAIAPGAIKTPMNAADFEGDQKMAKWVAEETPVGRWAEPNEVAQLTLFLAGRGADYINGAVIPVDGGWTIK